MEDEDGRLWIWIVVRLITAVIIATIVFGIVFGLVFQSPTIFYPGWVWNLIGILVFIWFVGWIFRWPWHHKYWSWDHEHEMRILRRRYARGEVTEAQFRKMMKVLKEDSKKRP